ncbi:MAG TPA: UDP-N-acetylmuramate dehydrogenase [Caulobacteraceae bacterium]|nr:UDP-N-acetylmuramate dehydrogenase [Caulobacteraceae bacterium]
MTDWRDTLPAVRGRIVRDEPLAPFTWLRVGGPADVLFLPADEADLAGFLKALDPDVPVTLLGVGSNTLVRDGGVEGVVIRLGKAFAAVEALDGGRVRAGAAALDAQVSKVAAAAGIAGLEFFTGVPGTVGGALVMNAGCYTQETKDVLVEAYGLTRAGEPVTFSNAEMRFSYRRSATAAETGVVFTGALFRGVPDDPVEVTRRMTVITARREETQPIREKTGGSTFKNPPGHSAWKLVDEAGWRGRPVGGAMFSPLHSNFLINTGQATAAEIEALGEAVRRDVRRKRGLELDWEIKRVGRPAE